MIVIFLIFLVLRMRHLFGYGKASYEVLSHELLAPNVYMLKLRTLERMIVPLPGQYVYLQTGLMHEEHPFSVLDYNQSTGEIAIAYKVFGSYTKKMKNITAGQRVYLDGPYGVFTGRISERNQPSVFIAGGIGVTPFVSHILRDSAQRHWLLYANKTKESAVLQSALKRLLGSRQVDILSQETSPAAHGDERGVISAGLISSYITEPLNYLYFICGPSGFMKTAESALHELGVPAENIETEEFDF